MNILVAYDRSRESHNALVSALDIAETLDATVIAVHAMPDDDADEERGEAILAEAKERAEKRDVPFQTELLVGDPLEVIPAYAEENDAHVIYVGHRGMSGGVDASAGSGRGSLGSVARGIVERTEIPVTVFDRGL